MKENCIAILGKQDQPTDAMRTFFSSGMDALVIGSFLVEK
jgi:predicted NodU family carbamoyl transferase